MAQVTADVVAAQAERLIPVLKPMMEYDKGLFGKIKTKPGITKVSSRVSRLTLQTLKGGDAGAVNLAGGDFGRSTASKYDVATVAPRSIVQRLEINYDAVHQTKGRPQAVFNLLTRETGLAAKQFLTFYDQQLMTAGDGVLATISAVAGDVITCNNAPFFTQLLNDRQKVAVYDSALAVNRGEGRILDIEGELVRFTFVGGEKPAGTVATDKILPAGVSGASPPWLFGLPYSITSSATGTFLGLNRATVKRIRSHTVAAASNALSPTHPRLLLDKVKQRMGVDGFKTDGYLWHLHPAQNKAWEDLAVLIERIDLGSGNKAVDLLPFTQYRIAGIPVFENIHAARDRMDLYNPSTWTRVESEAINWLTLQGKRVFMPSSTTDGSPVAAYLMYMIGWLEFVNDNPPANGAITGLAIPTGYDLLA